MGYRYPRIGYPFITDTSKKLVSRLCPAFNSHNVVSRWTCHILHLFHHVYPIVSFFSFLHPSKFFANLADISLAIQCSKFERNIHSENLLRSLLSSSFFIELFSICNSVIKCKIRNRERNQFNIYIFSSSFKSFSRDLKRKLIQVQHRFIN